jgi:nickel/cobalt transporter (NicO) family protein
VRMGGQIAVFHVLSAVIVVVIADFAVRQVSGQGPSDYRFVRLASYTSIILIGLWMLFNAIKAVQPRKLQFQPHQHHAGCGCQQVIRSQRGMTGVIALAIGAIPCTGAVLVLLFGIANDLLWRSVLLVGGISLGMAVALSGVGVTAIIGQRFLAQRMDKRHISHLRASSLLRIGGAAGVLFIGGVLFLMAW